MARGRAAGYDEQRELILAHAAALFARQGYHATSMNQVAEACALSKATLYHYYRDKDAMLVAIAEGHVVKLRALVDEELTRQVVREPGQQRGQRDQGNDRGEREVQRKPVGQPVRIHQAEP